MYSRALVLGCASLFMLSSYSQSHAAAVQPPALNLQEQLTVSGLSSGGYMAAQFHLAFAEYVQGAAILAAGPVYCAQNDLRQALAHCLNQPTASPALAPIATYLHQQQQQGNLASTEAIATSRVWLFSGSADQTVLPQVTAALYQQYQQWLPKEQLQWVNDQPFAHHFPTNKPDMTPCEESVSPFIGSCNYDAAGIFLAHLFGQVNPAATQSSGQLLIIDQHKLAAASRKQLARYGYLYVPQRCAEGISCRLHISFHGCRQDASEVGEAYVRQTGLNEYADTNDLVILYPQVEKSSINPFNPNGCWDWWGYSGANYATKQGKQLQAIQQLVMQLRQP